MSIEAAKIRSELFAKRVLLGRRDFILHLAIFDEAQDILYERRTHVIVGWFRQECEFV
jgi:hypothetical protein